MKISYFLFLKTENKKQFSNYQMCFFRKKIFLKTAIK